MMNFIIIFSLLLTTTFATESLVGKNVVFDYKGIRKVAPIGTKPIVVGDKRTVVVSWLELEKPSDWKQNSRTVKIDLNAPNVFIEVANLPLTLDGKKVDLIKGQAIIGKDNNIYEVVAVFANGEVGLRPFETKHGRLQQQKLLTVVHSSDFIETVSQKCIGNVCSGARVSPPQSFSLCPLQRSGYYHENKLVENNSAVVECDYKTPGKESQVVDHVFIDGTVVAEGQVYRRALALAEPTDSQSGVGQ